MKQGGESANDLPLIYGLPCANLGAMTPTQLSIGAKISVPFASQVLSGQRAPSRAMAFQIYDATGLQFGPLVNLTPNEIETVRRLDAKAA